MNIVFGILGSFALVMMGAWAFLPGAFGLSNFNRKHALFLKVIASCAWIILLGTHAYALYKLWSAISNEAEIMFLWTLYPLPFHIFYFSIFGRDVGTSGS